MSLYKAETRRLVKRRMIRYLVIAALLVLGVIASAVFVSNHKIGPAERAVAVQRAESSYQLALQEAAEERARCMQAKASGTARSNEFPEDCAQFTDPPRDMYDAASYLPSTFNFRETFGETLMAVAAILVLVAFLAGASFVGVEWSSGGMMNLLLWRPQRMKVLATKLAALLVGLIGLTVGAVALWTAAFWLIGTFRGTMAGMTSGAWQSFGLTGLRALALVLAAGVVGFALASIGRRTVAALGVAIGFAVIVQFGLGLVLALANVRFLEAWLLPTWVLAWMQKSVTLESYDSCNWDRGGCAPETLTLTWQQSGSLMLATAVVLLGVAMWTMRNRDVT